LAGFYKVIFPANFVTRYAIVLRYGSLFPIIKTRIVWHFQANFYG